MITMIIRTPYYSFIGYNDQGTWENNNPQHDITLDEINNINNESQPIKRRKLSHYLGVTTKILQEV